MKPKLYEIFQVIIFALLGIGLIYVVQSSLEKLKLRNTSGYEVRAQFRSLKQLQIGDDVRLAGVKIGSIYDTYLENGRAVALLHIEKKYTIPRDSIATILSAGLLGAHYVSISLGTSSEHLGEQSCLQTEPSDDLSTVIRQFGKIGKRLDRILSGFDEDTSENGRSNSKNSSFFVQLSQFFDKNCPKLDHIIEKLDTVISETADGNGTIGKLLKENTLHDDLRETAGQIREAAHRMDTLLASLQNVVDDLHNTGTLAKLLYDEKMAQDVATTIDQLRSFSEKLNDPHTTLGRLITGDELYFKVKDTFDKIDRAADGLTNSGPLTAVGVTASALF
jgi:phospholipid/cholesterol/gamma-HCH transport system substrate-binding protein